MQGRFGAGGIGVAVAGKPEVRLQITCVSLISEIRNGAQPIDQFVFIRIRMAGNIFITVLGHCNAARLKTISQHWFHLPTVRWRRDHSQRIWKVRLCSSAITNIISCGLKVAGRPLITG